MLEEYGPVGAIQYLLVGVTVPPAERAVSRLVSLRTIAERDSRPSAPDATEPKGVRPDSRYPLK
jgi:hypothetical protein